MQTHCRILGLLALCFAFGCCLIPHPPVHPPPNPGSFDGRVAAAWLPNGRDMKLLEDFAFIDSHSKRWQARVGDEINGASIPRALWSIVGSPYTGLYRNASVVHDVACTEKTEPWQDVHLMFYEACLVGGLDADTAELMYAAVYRWGPRWGPHEIRGTLNPSEAEVRQLQNQLQDLHAREGVLSPERIQVMLKEQ